MQEDKDTSAQKLAHDTAIVLPKKPSEGFPRSPILEKTLLQTIGVSNSALQEQAHRPADLCPNTDYCFLQLRMALSGPVSVSVGRSVRRRKIATNYVHR